MIPAKDKAEISGILLKGLSFYFYDDDSDQKELIVAAKEQLIVRICLQLPNDTMSTYDLKILDYQIMSGFLLTRLLRRIH